MKNDLAIQESWSGIWVPAKTPPDVVRKLFSATANTLADPVLRQQIEASGNVLAASESPEAFSAFIRREYAKWGEIVKLSGAKAE
jgi:tripartite-type tricarboxylate transporter receptor subunit TctC